MKVYWISDRTTCVNILLKCLQEHHISAIAWNMQSNSDTSTGEILLGTTKGNCGSVAEHYRKSIRTFYRNHFPNRCSNDMFDNLSLQA